MVFIEENAFENVICKLTAILFRPHSVLKPISSHITGNSAVCSNSFFRLTWKGISKLWITDLLWGWNFGDCWIQHTKGRWCRNCIPLQWRHNGHDSISNHHPHDCLLNRLSRHRSKKTSKLRVTGLCAGPVNSLHKWPVARKCFHLMTSLCMSWCHHVFVLCKYWIMSVAV